MVIGSSNTNTNNRNQIFGNSSNNNKLPGIPVLETPPIGLNMFCATPTLVMDLVVSVMILDKIPLTSTIVILDPSNHIMALRLACVLSAATQANTKASTSQHPPSYKDKGKRVVNTILMIPIVRVANAEVAQVVDTAVDVPPVTPPKAPLRSRVLSLLGSISGKPIDVLVDSGCSNNFVSTKLVK